MSQQTVQVQRPHDCVVPGDVNDPPRPYGQVGLSERFSATDKLRTLKSPAWDRLRRLKYRNVSSGVTNTALRSLSYELKQELRQ